MVLFRHTWIPHLPRNPYPAFGGTEPVEAQLHISPLPRALDLEQPLAIQTVFGMANPHLDASVLPSFQTWFGLDGDMPRPAELAIEVAPRNKHAARMSRP